MAKIAVLHGNEGGHPTRPVTVPNYVPGGPVFANRGGSAAQQGGQYWFDNSSKMPFGKGMAMESSASAPCAIASETEVVISGPFKHKIWIDRLDDSHRVLWSIGTNGREDGAQYLGVRGRPQGGGLFRLDLFGRDSGVGATLALSSSFTFPSNDGTPRLIVTERDSAGYLKLSLDGQLLVTSSAPWSVSITGYLAMFGLYDRVNQSSEGVYRASTGEMEFTVDEPDMVYPFAVPTSRFTNPAADTASTATAAAGAATVASSGGSTARGAGTAAAGVATVSAAGRSTKRTTVTAAAGAATTSAVGRTALRSTATAATGAASVSAAGAALFVASAVPADGTGSASASAASVAQAIGVSAGSASVSGAGSALVASVATAAVGTAAVSAITSGGAGSTASASAGLATTSAAGASKAVTSGQASGLATVAAVGAKAVRATAGGATGTAAASASGLSKAASGASAAGIATVSASGSSLAGSIATAIAAAGTSTVSAIVVSLARASGIAEGFSTVSAVGAGGTPNVLGSLIGSSRRTFSVRSSVQTSTRRNEQSSKR